MSWLPEEETNSLGSNFLPVVAERVVKEYGFTELKESVAGLGDWFLKALTAYNYDNKPERLQSVSLNTSQVHLLKNLSPDIF